MPYTKNELQEKWKGEWLASSRKAIFKLAPRTGKTRLTLNCLLEIGAKKVLIAFPRNDIQRSWEEEIKKLGINIQIIYTTFVSLHKHKQEEYDAYVYDEIHEASDNVLTTIGIMPEKPVICLSGSMTKGTEENILSLTGLYICSRYSIEEAVNDGIICDYEIHVHKISLYGKEKAKFSSLMYRMKNAKGSYYNMLKLQAIGMLQKSEAKIEYTKKLIEKYRGERLLIFCGQTEVADSLGIPVYHSKNKEKQLFEDFCEGKGDKLACVKLIQAGITILPINRGIINYNSGASEDCCQKICRFLGKELYFPGKKAIIDFLSINEEFDQQRVKTALNLFDYKKIIYENI